MSNDMGDEESCTKPLGRCSVLSYGVGHMLNDITSACWFTYLLVFLTDIGLSPRYTFNSWLEFSLIAMHLLSIFFLTRLGVFFPNFTATHMFGSQAFTIAPSN